MLKRLCLAVLFLLTLASTPYAETMRIIGADVTTGIIISGVTTNTTSTAVDRIPGGPKVFYGEVVCTSGSCTQTQAIYGSMTSTAANGILLCTLTLSATTRAQDTCPIITASFPWYYVITTATTGTAATGAVYALY